MFPNFFDPAGALQLGLRSSAVLAEAQSIIAFRTLGMFGFWYLPKRETTRMVTEKIAALQEAQLAMFKTAVGGGTALEVTSAALRPVERRTHANLRRLSRSKPKG